MFDEIVLVVDGVRAESGPMPAALIELERWTRGSPAKTFAAINVRTRPETRTSRGGFTAILTRGLAGAAADTRGRVTSDSLTQFVNQQLRASAPESPESPLPLITRDETIVFHDARGPAA
jgi:hypothetical protein